MPVLTLLIRFSVAVLMLAGMLARGAPVAAASFTVTNLGDSGAGSLRVAIDAANANPGADTITFAVSGTIPLASTLPVVSDAAGLTIDGTGQRVTISGTHAVVVIVVNLGAVLTAKSLTVANGVGFFLGGGGIVNVGTLTLTDSAVTGNTATAPGAGGAGILNGNGGTLTLD